MTVKNLNDESLAPAKIARLRLRKSSTLPEEEGGGSGVRAAPID